MTDTSARWPKPPKHAVVREHLRQLLDGAEPGTPVPSERVLVQQFGMARTTVRQAVDALVLEGLLERIPSRGTFVARPRGRPGRNGGLASFTEDMARRGMAVESRTLDAERVRATGGVARALGLAEGAGVLRWRRLRRAAELPMCVEDSYLDEALVPGLLDNKPLPASLYDELARRDLRPTWAEDSIRADQAQAAEARLLEVPPGSPVLRRARRALSADLPVVVSRSTYRADRYIAWVQYGDR